MYKVTAYTKKRAKALNVEVRPSKAKGKKLDVFSKGKKVASVGAIGYQDYPTMLEKESKSKLPKGTAKKRQKLYKKRHQNNRTKVRTNGYYADKLLW